MIGNEMLLSIIIPVYNVQDYLEQCLESVIFPDLNNYELIIVDDGSTDNCPSIIDQYHSKYPTLIKVIHQENKGLGFARNEGIKIATGRFIAFLDSDDYYLNGKEALLKIFDLINEDKYDVFYSDNYYQKKELDASKTESRGKQTAYVWTRIIRTSVLFDNSILFESRSFEDILFTYKILKLNLKHYHLPFAYYVYRYRINSLTNQDELPYSYIEQWKEIFSKLVVERSTFNEDTKKLVSTSYYGIIMAVGKSKYYNDKNVIESYKTFTKLFTLSSSLKENIIIVLFRLFGCKIALKIIHRYYLILKSK